MASAQLKMRMCNMGIVFWIPNNSWQQKHEWPLENSQCNEHCIMRFCSDKGPNKGTKQTSGHNCSPFKRATDHSAYGVWDSGTHRRSCLEWLFLFQRPGGQMRMGLTERWSELLSPFLIQNSISQLHPPSCSPNLAPADIYCFQNSNFSHKGPRHAITENSLKIGSRLERIHQKEDVKVFWQWKWVRSPCTNGVCDAWCFCCPVCGAFREQGRLGCGMWDL